MSNYYESARSNYFRVKDLDAFKQALRPLDVEVYEHEGEKQRVGQVCLLASGDGGWPSMYIDEHDVEHDVDLFALVAQHLVPGSIAVFMQVGAEKLRYVTGSAVAINHEGRQVSVDINDIYALAQETFGDKASITRAEY